MINEYVIQRENWDKITACKIEFIFEIKSEIILQPGPAADIEGVQRLVEIVEKWHTDVSYSSGVY